MTYLFSAEILWYKCNFIHFGFTCVFFLKFLLFFSMLHCNICPFVKGKCYKCLFHISLKHFNFRQFSRKILFENLRQVLFPLMILYVPIKIFKNWSYKWKVCTKKPNCLKKIVWKFVTSFCFKTSEIFK